MHVALFDIHVVNANARSYLSQSSGTVLASAEAEKRKYCHAIFMPLCFLMDS